MDTSHLKWNVEEVVIWCSNSLQVPQDSELCQNLVRHDITGDLLSELSLADCKELCGDDEDDLELSLRFKVLLNQIRHNESNTQYQQLAVSLEKVHSTLNGKLQEFQSQCNKLRCEIIEVAKNSATSPSQAYIKTPTRQSPKVAIAFSVNQELGNLTLTHNNGGNTTSHFYSANPSAASSSSSLSKANKNISPSTKKPTASRFNSMDSIHKVPKASMNTESIYKKHTSTIAEPLKQLKASKEDSCEKILKSALRRHNLNEEDWRQYVLVICYGDQESVLSLDEKPVVIFKNLKQQGLNPAIILRHSGDFAELNMGSETPHSITPGGRL